MDAQEKYEYWLDIAQYDLETANVMCSGGRWLYVVFMCEQAVEKLVKGLYTLYIDDNVPKTHNISSLVRTFEDKLPDAVSPDKFILFEDLRSFYLNGRYADFKQKLSASTDEATAKNYLNQTKEVFAWLLTQKP
ncbi:MAG: HEPN domain-containing protein [Clostridiales Family XIII bacterium]|jgi:HEPN domain-containing protein|nr:HEPN domain-containing protein [Clostridiales Family XIII bacterium]